MSPFSCVCVCGVLAERVVPNGPMFFCRVFFFFNWGGVVVFNQLAFGTTVEKTSDEGERTLWVTLRAAWGKKGQESQARLRMYVAVRSLLL